MTASTDPRPCPPVNRMQLLLGGEPLAATQPFVETPVDDMIAQLAQWVAPQLPKPTAHWCRRVTRTDLFRLFPEAFAQAERGVVALEQFLHAIVRTNQAFDLHRAPPSWGSSLADELLQDLVLPRPRPSARSLAELAVTADDQGVWTSMNAMLLDVTAQGLAYFCQGLRRLREHEYVGRIEFLAPTVARFFFYRWAVQEEVLRETRSSRATQRDLKQTLRQVVEYHEILQAQSQPVQGARLPMPPAVAALVQGLPPFLGKLVQVVSGQEIFRRIVERDLKTAFRTEREVHRYHPDPAIVFGDYVLTGWGADEV